MIRHIVFFQVKRENWIVVREGLSRLQEIPHSRTLEVAENIKKDLWDNQVDFVVCGEFEDEAALDAYKNHPVYAAATKYVRPLRETRVAADFVSEPSART